MAYTYNNCVFVGRLTRDPEMHKFGDDRQKTVFTLAINRGYKKEDGSVDTDFIPVCVWGSQAKIARKYLLKGSPVLIEGRLHIDSYEKDGENKKKTEIQTTTFQLLEKLPQINDENT